jgi:hypothetical protein
LQQQASLVQPLSSLPSLEQASFQQLALVLVQQVLVPLLPLLLLRLVLDGAFLIFYP